MTIKGICTAEGTSNYQNRFKKSTSSDFFSTTHQHLHLSTIGIGTFKGEANDIGDIEWKKSINKGLLNGINVIDAAIKYRNMRSEKIIGQVLKKLINKNELKREETFISTKGGLISFPENSNTNEYLQKHIIDERGIKQKYIFQNYSCFDPNFIAQEIDISRSNLGLQTIDCFFLHNPEIIFLNKSINKPYDLFYSLFEVLENKVENGSIGAYGIASWNGFRRKSSSPLFIDFIRLNKIAQEVGGFDHNFNFVELPLSVGMPYIYNQKIKENGKSIKFLQKLYDERINIFSSASMYEGNLPELFNLERIFKYAGKKDSNNNHSPSRISFPLSENSIAQLFQLLINLRKNKICLINDIPLYFNDFGNIYISALNAVRSLKYITTALAGVEKVSYLNDHLRLKKVQFGDEARIKEFWENISS